MEAEIYNSMSKRKVTIVDYGMGNIWSVISALNYLNVEVKVSDSPKEILLSETLLLPGVGSFRKAMDTLRRLNLDRAIIDSVQGKQHKILGICLGMQLLCSYSEENNTPCLSVFDERVVSFLPNGTDKIPQVGWNTISGYGSTLFNGLVPDAYCYFVHGYYAALGPDTIATTHYILPYSAALQKNNFYGVQFHPEKSAAVGEKILQNFLDIK